MSSVPDINALLNEAHEEGILSKASFGALNVVNVGNQIQAGLGAKVDDVEASEVLLVAVLIDDSGSIRFEGNSQNVRDGYNLLRSALMESKSENAILLHVRYLNGHVLCPFVPIEQAPEMDTSNFNPGGGTPLYDQAVVMLGTVLTKAQEYESQGIAVRTATLVLTDGADMGSTESTPTDVKALANDMHRQEMHMVYGMGVDDGGTDFAQVFRTMGIPNENHLIGDASAIRAQFGVFSKSAISGQAISASIGGGFGTP